MPVEDSRPDNFQPFHEARPLEDVFSDFTDYVKRKYPDYDFCLNPPASPGEIETLEQTLGFALPEDLASLYRIANG